MYAITVWSAFNGNVEQRKDEWVGEGERWSQAPQVSVKGVSWGLHSHSVVPGGLEVRSYMTLEIPGIFLISFTIFSTTCMHREEKR